MAPRNYLLTSPYPLTFRQLAQPGLLCRPSRSLSPPRPRSSKTLTCVTWLRGCACQATKKCERHLEDSQQRQGRLTFQLLTSPPSSSTHRSICKAMGRYCVISRAVPMVDNHPSVLNVKTRQWRIIVRSQVRLLMCSGAAPTTSSLPMLASLPPQPRSQVHNTSVASMAPHIAGCKTLPPLHRRTT